MSKKRLPRLVVCNIQVGTGVSIEKIIIEHCRFCGYSSEPSDCGHQTCDLAGVFVVHPDGCVEDNGIPPDTCPFPTVVEAATVETVMDDLMRAAIELVNQSDGLAMDDCPWTEIRAFDEIIEKAGYGGELVERRNR